MGGKLVLGGWKDVSSACGFEGRIGALCGSRFENSWVLLYGSGGVSLCGSITR